MDYIQQIIIDFWATLGEMAPYLLFGFFVAGLLSVLISPRQIETHLGGKGLWPVIKASLFGVPLPLCSCGVIPVAVSLRKHKASKAAAISFLLSTPQTGVDSILVTYSLLGPVFAVFRPVIAFVTGLIGGLGVEAFDKENEKMVHSEPQCGDECCDIEKPKTNPILRIFKFGFWSMPADIGKSMLVGLIIAAILSVVIPPDFFVDKIGTGIGAMVIMLFLGIPVYVCATASVPIAAVLLMKGLSPGAVIVFLMTGPATNAVGLATIYKSMGTRVAVIYLVTVVICALGSGLLLDYVLNIELAARMADHGHSMLPEYIKHVSAIILLGVLLAPTAIRMLKTETKSNTN